MSVEEFIYDGVPSPEYQRKIKKKFDNIVGEVKSRLAKEN